MKYHHALNKQGKKRHHHEVSFSNNNTYHGDNHNNGPNNSDTNNVVSDSKLNNSIPANKSTSQKPTSQKMAKLDVPQLRDEPRFTFDEVKEMIEKLINKHAKNSPPVGSGLKRLDVNDVVLSGHSTDGCKQLITKLVKGTRRTRTLHEVLVDIRDNLDKRTYTEIIHRASVIGESPRKPPSAYLLYHQDRYNQLKNENSLAVEVSKIVAEEWKTLPDKERREYRKKHDKLVSKYESEMRRLGLIDEEAPKRPKSAKSLFIYDRLADFDYESWSKSELASKKEEYGSEYDRLPRGLKAKWIALHKEHVKKFQQQKQDYIQAHPHLNHSAPEKKTRESTKVKPPEPPKSAWKFYLAKKMPEGTDGSDYDAIKKALKIKFNQLKEKKLLKFIRKAVQDKERYEAECEEFRKMYPDKEIAKVKTNLPKDHLKLYAKIVENRPHLPAPTAYLHYCSKMLTDMNMNHNCEEAPTKRMQTASVAWRELSEEEKNAAMVKHSADIQRYINEMEKWLANVSEARRAQLMAEEPKSNPDYWRKRLNRLKKAERKRAESETYMNVDDSGADLELKGQYKYEEDEEEEADEEEYDADQDRQDVYEDEEEVEEEIEDDY